MTKKIDKCIETNKKIQERIHFLRKVRNKTQKELADSVGVSLASVHLWKKGGNITIDNFLKICEFLGTTPNTLLGYNEMFDGAMKWFEGETHFEKYDFDESIFC